MIIFTFVSLTACVPDDFNQSSEINTYASGDQGDDGGDAEDGDDQN